MDAQVQSRLQQHAPYLIVEDDGRVKCTLNGHRLPATLAAIDSFVNGAKFKRLKKHAEIEASFKQYEPFIIPSKNIPDKLYCALTCMLISKNADSVAHHLKGKAYSKAKEKFQRGEQQLMEEPEFEESQPSGSEDEMEEGLREDLEDMELELLDTDNESDAVDEASTEATQPKGQQKQKKKQTVKQKADGKKAGKGKGKAEKGAIQPVTPPRQPTAKASQKDPLRATKRLRTTGSRPKKVKRAVE